MSSLASGHAWGKVPVMLGRMGGRDLVAVVGLGLAGFGIPLWLSTAAGAIGIPTNDDWVYMRGAETLFRTGSIDMPGHTAASIGQLAMVQPLLWLSGGNAWAFTAFGLVMGLIGIASTYLLARCFVGAGSAVLVTLLVEVFPGFVRATASFMTDVPAYALAVLCLLLGVRWLRGNGRRATLAASLVIGVLAVSIREFAIAAPAAILVAAWARSRADERVWLAGASGAFGAAVAFVLLVAASIPGHGVPVTPDLWRLIFLGPAFTTLAAVLLPVIALAVARQMAVLRPGHIILAAGIVVVGLILPYGSLLGSFWMENGLGGNAFLTGVRDPVVPETAWVLSTQLASFAGILLAALALRWGQDQLVGVASLSTVLARAIRIARSPEAPLVLFVAAYAAGLVAFGLLGVMLDRYLFPLVPVTAILLLRRPTKPAAFGRSHAFAHAAFVWLAASAFIIAANSFAYDAARWRAGQAAVALGYDPTRVDAGYEWVGQHESGDEYPVYSVFGRNLREDVLATYDACAVVSNSPLSESSVRLIREDRSAYPQFLFFGPAQPLYLYAVVADGCPPPPTAVLGGPTPRSGGGS